MNFEAIRLFDPTKDRITDLPIYDQLDWLIMFFTTPNYSSGASIKEAALFIRGMSYQEERELNSLMSDIKLLIQQLLDDKYLTGPNPEDVNGIENIKAYRPTLKAKMVLEGIGGYRHTIFIEKSEERTVHNLRVRQDELTSSTIRTNKRTILMLGLTVFVTIVGACISGMELQHEYAKGLQEVQLEYKEQLIQSLTKELSDISSQQASTLRAYDSLVKHCDKPCNKKHLLAK